MMELVYIVYPDKEQAISAGGGLVKENLAACVNILDNMASVYFWQGALQSDNEVVLLAKTTTENRPKLCAKVKLDHPYDCPAIFSIGTSYVDPDYEDWLKSNT